MFNHLKNWWQIRKAKHYLKSHRHLLVDIFLLLVIIGLMVYLVIIKNIPQPKVDAVSVGHISKITIGTSKESLIVKSELDSVNINSGESFIVHLSLESNSKYPVSGISLTPSFKNRDFSVSHITNKTSSSTLIIKDNKLILDQLLPGQKLESDISIIIKAKSGSIRYVDWFLKTAFTERGISYNKDYDVDSLKLITNLKINVNAYYHSRQGDQLGSGPIPPMVGLPTNYWVFFEVDNQGNGLNNLTVSAKLPDSVTLSSRKTLSAGEFSYDESQKRITWKVDKTTIGNGRYQSGFEIQLFPTTKQIGLEPLLLTNISYVATDSYTGERLSGKLPSIDTDLPYDVINKGQGKVLE